MAIDMNAQDLLCSQLLILVCLKQAKSVLNKEDASLPSADTIHYSSGSSTEPSLPGNPSGLGPLGPSRPPKKAPYMTGNTGMTSYDNVAKQVSYFYACQNWCWLLPCV